MPRQAKPFFVACVALGNGALENHGRFQNVSAFSGICAMPSRPSFHIFSKNSMKNNNLVLWYYFTTICGYYFTAFLARY
jgi:hypothetical protein